jgi:beta-carotene hydroxylase
MIAIERPFLDRSLYRPSHVWAAAYLLYAATLFAVPAWASYHVAISDWPLVVRIPTGLLLTILAAYGINMMGFVGHEGMHASLLRNRKASALVGIFWASSVLTYFEVGFAVSHWNHHRYTNQEGDPDIEPVARLNTWWKRLLLSRVIYNTLYFKYTLRLARGEVTSFKYKMAFEHRDQVLFARANLVFAALWVIVYGMIFAYNWRAGVFGVLLPMLALTVIAACQIYIDHAGLEDGTFRNAYSRTSPLMTLLFFGANYHMEHHAYPGIPCYRLPRVARLLREKGTYEALEPPITRGFLASFRPLARPYVVSRNTPDFDAFRVAAPVDNTPQAAPGTAGQTAMPV